MTDSEANTEQLQGIGAGISTLSGILSAFGVAACCGIPMLLASAGLLASLGASAAWLGVVSSVTAPWRNELMLFSLVSLSFAAYQLWQMQRRAQNCGNGASPLWLRLTLLAGITLGACLLVIGYLYV